MRSLLPLVLLSAACGSVRRPAPPYLERVHTWSMHSQVLDESRRIFVYLPPGYEERAELRLPVLYMPDGGIAEDLPHVADAVHAGGLWGTLQPLIVVGIENTDRRRDLTSPTEVARDREIAPRAGGAAAFRAFLRDELMVEIDRRYRTNGRNALIGESLAGRFVVETFLETPDLFAHCFAFSPSLWWNDGELVERAGELLARRGDGAGTIYLSSANEPRIPALTRRFAELCAERDPSATWWHYLPRPDEHHDTIYRASAPLALRHTFPLESQPR